MSSKLENKIHNKWTDEEVLEKLGLFLKRVNVQSSFIQNSDGLFTHEVIVFQAGDKVLVSEPNQLEWPLQTLPKPKALETSSES